MSDAGRTVWTIGHSTRSIEEFCRLLKGYKIAALADVRQFPGSRRHPQFGQNSLAQSLAEAEIEYVHLPELGGRRTVHPDSPNTAWRNPAFRGYADYMMTDSYRAGIERLTALAAAKPTAIMCAEAVWWRCHRGLISDYLKVMGWTVRHILSETKTEQHPFTPAARVVDGRLTYAAPANESPPVLKI